MFVSCYFVGVFNSPNSVEKRPSMVRNIRNLFQRAGLTRQEVRTLHGIVAELSTLRQRAK